jgi:hypothetical protein
VERAEHGRTKTAARLPPTAAWEAALGLFTVRHRARAGGLKHLRRHGPLLPRAKNAFCTSL